MLIYLTLTKGKTYALFSKSVYHFGNNNTKILNHSVYWIILKYVLNRELGIEEIIK